MGCFRSVLGDVKREYMGTTYTHEHVFCKPYTADKDPTLAIDNLILSAQELKLFKAAGGTTLVEGTTIDYGRNPLMLVKASQISDVHLIASTGYYLFDHHPIALADTSIEEVAQLFIKEIEVGMGDTQIKAGQIKCAVSLRFIHPNERICLVAAAKAQKVTNAPIWIHHGGMLGEEILDILEDSGADLEKVVLGHMDRNPDPYEYRRIAKKGCYLSIDNLARVHRYPIQTNIDMLKDLFDMGYMDKVVISADFGRTAYLISYGGGPGFSYILASFIQRLMEQCQINRNDIDTLFIKNPENIYAVF